MHKMQSFKNTQFYHHTNSPAVLFLLDNGRKENDMVEDFNDGLMVPFTKDTGETVWLMEEED